MQIASTPPSDERFSAEQAGEYVRLATSIEQHHEEGLSYQQLVEVAAEVGISEETLRVAIQQAKQEKARQHEVGGSGWRIIADWCLEILCLKPIGQERPNPST